MANNKNKEGWIIISRRLFNHWIWTSDRPFDDRSAWVDLIGLMNHEDKTIQIGVSTLTIHRGQHFTSLVKLANRWRWDKRRVSRYLNMLEKEKMIVKDGTHNGTLLTLVNYEKFASPRTADGTADGTANSTDDSTANGTANGTQTNNDKRIIKNDKELKEKEGRRLPPPSGGGEWQ